MPGRALIARTGVKTPGAGQGTARSLLGETSGRTRDPPTATLGSSVWLVTSPSRSDPPALARSSPQLLADRTFGPWFWGLLISNAGNWLFNVTAAIVVFDLSGSALQVGLVSVAQFLPLVVFAPFAGALSDRRDRRRLLLASQAWSATVAAAIAVAAVMVGAEGFGSAWPVIAAAGGIGIGQAVAAPALSALVPDLVPDHDLETGVALTSLTFNAGRALGPAVSGVLLATLGAEVAFVANAVSFGALILALLIIRTRPRDPVGRSESTVRAGLRYVRGDRVVLLLLAGVAATGFAADPMITLAPPLAATVGGGASLVAVLVSAFGIAAAPASALSGRAQRTWGSLKVAGTGTTLLAAGLTTAAVAPVPAVTVAGFAITGIGFVFALTGFTTVLQRRVPDGLRGRVMALWSIAFLGNRPIAAALDGAAADLVGARWALLLAISVALAGTATAVALARRQDLHQPTRPSPQAPRSG
jgi:MFS family permease